MKCKKCGASMLATDKFCNQCGWKVEKKARCPECGAALRDGAKFCPECGRMIGEDSSDGTVYVKGAETLDMSIDDIEQNIVSMTQREMHISDERPHKPKKSAPAPEQKKKSIPAPEPEKRVKPAPVKKRVYEEWDEDEDEDEEEDDGGNIMTIISVGMAFLILALAAVLVFAYVKKQSNEDNGENVEESVDNNETDVDGDDEGGQESEAFVNEADGAAGDQGSGQVSGTLSIVSNVNVRDNPTTEGSNVIKVAKAGETYEYVGTADDGNWYIIILEDGSMGYVFEKYVSVQ